MKLSFKNILLTILLAAGMIIVVKHARQDVLSDDAGLLGGYAQSESATETQTGIDEPQAQSIAAPPPPETADEAQPKQNSEYSFDPNPGVISTVAGIGRAGYSGDDDETVADQAMLNSPCAVRVDADDNIYILDCGNRRLRKVFPDKNITTIAGNGLTDFPAENIPAENFSLKKPSDFAIDSHDNIYIADAGLNRIFKIDINRNLTFFAGNGQPENTGDGGPAYAAGLDAPSSIAIDEDGNIFVYASGVVRKINADGVIKTVAVTDEPADMDCRAVDYDGNLYMAEKNYVLKISGGKTIVIAGSGRAGYYGDGSDATLAQLDSPSCVSVGKDGSVYIADTGNNAIRKITYKK